MSGENETVKLIRCYVKNQNDEKSLRYIDMESYNLWQHIMISKHGFEICDKALCLWVNEAEFLKKQMIYVSAGEIEEVTRVFLSIHDIKYGYCYRSDRFILTDDLESVKETIVSHIGEEIKQSGNFHVQEVHGYCIIKEKDIKNAVVGIQSVAS